MRRNVTLEHDSTATGARVELGQRAARSVGEIHVLDGFVARALSDSIEIGAELLKLPEKVGE
jgi:hypothetical protein